MPLSKTNVELSYSNVVAGVPIVVDIPAFAVEEIYVKYGAGKAYSLSGTDFLVSLDEPNPVPPPTTQYYQFVTITPTATLLAKIALDGTNVIYVGRTLALTTDFTELDAFTRANLDVEFARTNMKLQQLQAAEVISALPDPRAGHSFQMIRVNADATAYEFIDTPGGGDMFRINNLADVVDPVASLANIGGQPHHVLLDAISGLSNVQGYVVHDGANSFAKRVFQAGAGITLGNADGFGGNTTISVTGGLYQPLNANLSALAGLDATAGVLVQTAASTFLKRVMAATVGAGILISNPAGTAGNPTFTIDQAFAPTWSGAHVFSNTNAITLTGATATLALVAPSGSPAVIISGVVGVSRHIMFRTDTRERWRLLTDATAEGGSNVGSDFRIFAMNDAGSAAIFTPIIITRSTGAVSFGTSISVPVGGMLYNGVDILARANTWTADQTISKASAVLTVNATSGSASIVASAAAGGAFISAQGSAGNVRLLTFKTGTAERWRLQVDGSAESTGDVGSNFQLQRYDDAGTTMLGNVLSFSRATGDMLVDFEVDKNIPIIRAHNSANQSGIGYFEQINNRPDGNTSFQGRYGAAFHRTDGTAIAATAVVGSYAFGGQWGVDSAHTPAKVLYAASISGVAEGSFTAANAMPIGITFRTGVIGDPLAGPNVYHGTDRVRISSDGGMYAIGVSGGSKGMSAGNVTTINFPVIYEDNVSLAVKYKANFAVGQQPATATNDNAAAGMVGEYMEQVIASGSATALTTNVAKTVAQITLTPGDWDITIMALFAVPASTSITQILQTISTVTNTLQFPVGGYSSRDYSPAIVPGAGLDQMMASVGPYRVSITANTTYYLVTRGIFTVSTLAAYGFIRARRPR